MHIFRQMGHGLPGSIDGIRALRSVSSDDGQAPVN
jgi:hypothetical protein